MLTAGDDEGVGECPQCGGDSYRLEELGDLEWYRCEDCGWDHTDYARGDDHAGED